MDQLGSDGAARLMRPARGCGTLWLGVLPRGGGADPRIKAGNWGQEGGSRAEGRSSNGALKLQGIKLTSGGLALPGSGAEGRYCS